MNIYLYLYYCCSYSTNDVLSMARVRATGTSSRRGGAGAIDRNKEWEERGATHLVWVVVQPSCRLLLQPHPLEAEAAAALASWAGKFAARGLAMASRMRI